MSLPPFTNEPLLELRIQEVRAALQASMTELEQMLPIRVPLWIGENRVFGEDIHSTDPGNPNRIIAVAPKTSPEDAVNAVAAATQACTIWATTPIEARAEALHRAADWMRKRRFRLAALCVREAGKPWSEADADIAEAIDFLEYYARGAIDLAHGATLLQVSGEHNTMRYRPRGIVAVISPWNFPVAIPTGMAAAALATGNVVILKPAEQTPGCGAMVVEALRAGGVPSSAISLLPGEGSVGSALVTDPRVHTIAFTGSSSVGQDIIARAAAVAKDQRHIKRVIAEMGGKNCVIIDDDADLDEAVPALMRSAFAYAGQKCSAVSRVLVHESVADLFIKRVVGALTVLQVGQADTWGTDVSPVIEHAAQQRFDHYIDIAASQGTLAAHYEGTLPQHGWFCRPTVATNLPAECQILTEEIFGPMLTIERFHTIEKACDRIDEIPFALTGALFTRNPHTVAYVTNRSPVGNLYINRHTTGAIVGRQPFGGNRLSGTGTKAGGPDYLLHFVEPQVITENTVRHGLTL